MNCNTVQFSASCFRENIAVSIDAIFRLFQRKQLEKYILFKLKKLFPPGTFLFATYKNVLPFTEGAKRMGKITDH